MAPANTALESQTSVVVGAVPGVASSEQLASMLGAEMGRNVTVVSRGSVAHNDETGVDAGVAIDSNPAAEAYPHNDTVQVLTPAAMVMRVIAAARYHGFNLTTHPAGV